MGCQYVSRYADIFKPARDCARRRRVECRLTPPEEGARRGRMSATADMRRVMHAQACAGHDARGLCRRKHVSADPCGRPREVALTPHAARECSRVPDPL